MDGAMERQFSDKPTLAIKKLIKEESLLVLEDIRSLENKLNDMCGNFQNEIFLLISSFKRNIHKDLLNCNLDYESVFQQMAWRVQEKLFFEEEVAQWIVLSLYNLLGISKEKKKRKDRAKYSDDGTIPFSTDKIETRTRGRPSWLKFIPFYRFFF